MTLTQVTSPLNLEESAPPSVSSPPAEAVGSLGIQICSLDILSSALIDLVFVCDYKDIQQHLFFTTKKKPNAILNHFTISVKMKDSNCISKGKES